MTTLGAMIDRIDDELDRGGGIDTQIQAEILSAIKHYENQRYWFNEGQSTASTVAGTPNIAVPTDLLEPIRMDLTSGSIKSELRRLNYNQYRDMDGNDAGGVTGEPCEYAFFADQFWLVPTPDAVYTLEFSYTRTLTALSAAGDTNAWMTDGEELIRSRAAAAVNIRYLRDPMAQKSAMFYASRGDPYLSTFEAAAHKALLRKSRLMSRTGRLYTDLGRSGAFNIYTGDYR